MNDFFTPESAAVFFSRILLGILFTMQGYDKIFSMRMTTVIQTIEPAYRRIRLPRVLIVLAAFFTSYIEFIGGLCLIFGLFKYYVLYLLGIDLLIAAFGMSLVDPVWKMDIVFPRFLLLIFLLLFPPQYDILLLDRLFF